MVCERAEAARQETTQCEQQAHSCCVRVQSSACFAVAGVVVEYVCARWCSEVLPHVAVSPPRSVGWRGPTQAKPLLTERSILGAHSKQTVSAGIGGYRFAFALASLS